MTLNGVPHTSSFCSTPPSLSPNTLGVRSPLNGTPRLEQSGHLADTTQSTGYEPKTCIDVSSEHTSINFPKGRDNFNLENDLKITVSEDSDHLPQWTTARSSRHSVAGTVPALLNLGSWSSTKKLVRKFVSIADSVSSTGKLMQGNESVASVEWHSSRRKEDWDLKMCANIIGQTASQWLPGTESWVGRSRRKRSPEKMTWSWSWSGDQKMGTKKFRNSLLGDSSRTRISKIGTTSGESMRWSGSEKRLIYVENWRWGIDFIRKDNREQAMKLKNHEECATKRQIKSGNWRMKNSLRQERDPTAVSLLLA